MIHAVRSSYGWVDDQIFDRIESFGYSWLLDSYKMIQEDKRDELRLELLMKPISRSPFDEKAGRSLQDLSKKIDQLLDGMTPWEKDNSRMDRLKKRVKPGTIAVMLDAGDVSSNPLFKNAEVLK